MKRFFVSLVILVLALAACGVAYRAYAQVKASSDKAEIEALYKQYSIAFAARNVDKIMQSYLPGNELFVFDVTRPRQHLGWADYKKDWEELFAAFPGPLKDEVSDLSISTHGAIGYGHHIESGFFTHKDGSRVDIAVRVTDVYRKVNSKWLIVQEHVSVPVDIHAGKADLLSKP